MKKLFYFFLIYLSANTSLAQTYVGHRENGLPICETTTQQLEAVIVPVLSNYSEVHVTGFELNDVPAIPDYQATLTVNISYKETSTSTDITGLTVQFYITYNPTINKYIDSDPGFGHEVDGGRKFCVKQNCVGCPKELDEKGKLTGCGDCVPVLNGNGPNQQPYWCRVAGADGTGNPTSGILIGIASIITALASLFQ